MEAIDLNNLKVFRGKLVSFQNGQIANATVNNKSENFTWDGLALLKRDATTYLNEPAVTGGNPVIAGDKVMFNDMLGTTQGTVKDGKYSATSSTLFGETSDKSVMFTGKPMIDGLGYSFLFRSYRPELAKWQTADPLGYPDGFNNFAYVNNGVVRCIDILGAKVYWASRDLASSPIGNHHYLVIIPDNPSDFSNLQTYNGGKKGYTIGGFNENGYLNYKKNNSTDTEAINEYYGGPDKGWDPEFHEVKPPAGMSDTEFINKIQSTADRYSQGSIVFKLTEQNCAAWVNTLLKLVGVLEKERIEAGEFFGVDWGEEDLLPNGAFE